MKLRGPVRSIARAIRPAPVIGYTKSGRPVFPILGNDDTAVKDMAERHNALVTEAQDLIKSLDGAAPNDEQREKLRSIDEEYRKLDADLKVATEDDEVRARLAAAKPFEEKIREEHRPALYGGMSEADEKALLQSLQTPGEAFTESQAYRSWMESYPSGGPSMNGNFWSSQTDVGIMRDMLGLTDATSKLRGVLTPARFRSLLTADAGSAGTLVQSLRRGLIEPGLVRPLTLRDLVTTIPVATDTIEWVREVSRTSAAAPVEEATALTGSSGTKPQGALAFTVEKDTVKTIAEWIAITKRILSDAAQLRGYVDGFLQYDLALALEDQMASGDGTGENFLGILNVPGVQTQSGADNQIDDIRAAKRKVRVGGRTNANGILINPEDMEAIDVLKAHNTADTAGSYAYLGSNPFQFSGNDRLWGLPIVESEAVDQGTAIVADFTRAVLYDRESTSISVGTVNDDFIRNIVRVLAELRAGFGVIRPKAFCVISGW